MNTYEIRVTNTQDDNDFCTQQVESSDISAITNLIADGYKVSDIEFNYNGNYIVIFQASDEGYMYDIYRYKEDYENGKDSLDGGQCTSTLSNAIEMALSQA